MNKQSIAKLALFLTGLEQRLTENTDFFKKMTAVYKSGTKDYPAVVALLNGKAKINFMGNTETIEVSWVGARLSKFAEGYDSLQVVYEERGTTIYIDADNKSVKMSTKETAAEEIVKTNHAETAQVGNRDYLIKVGHADTLLQEIGILGSNGKVRNDMVRKYNQIDHFIELIDGMLRSLCEKHETITVLDCGCGKSYLSFVLNYYIKEVLKKPCYFIGLDYSNTVIDASKKIASGLGYHNMEFKVTDIRNYTAHRKIQLVISLHACDTATDEAIALAVNNKVESMVIVPCCHRELLSQYDFPPLEPVLKHGILKARIADAITDGLRALLLEALGYKVSIVEYISPLETPKNLMMRADRVQSSNKKAMEDYVRIKELLNIHPMLERLVSPYNND